jgi:dTDP-4-dehydrorhamnose 3,5-epimerase
MRLVPAGIHGAWFVELTLHRDERGAFGRTWCREAFRESGVAFEPVQCNISRNPKRGTLRGMHYQRPPSGEAKLIQCVRGRIHDVAIDLRRGSPTFGQSAAAELSAEGDTLFFIPEGCAHGFLTLEPDTDVFYYMGHAYVAGAGAGVRWNDPAFSIRWPHQPAVMSERDASYPDFDAQRDAIA